MDKVNYKEVKFSNILENLGGNTKYSLKYINENKGEYPVYSAKTTGDMNKGYINTFDYNMECLQITTDGAKAGTIIYREKGKFSIGPATRIWYIKNNIDNLLLKYIEIKLKSIFNSKNFSWTNKASLYRIENIKIRIPIDDKGNFDINKQKEIVKKYKIIEERKKELKEKLDFFKNLQFDFINSKKIKTISIKIKDIFDINRGKSLYTKSYCKLNEGVYPVYSANNNIPLDYRNNYDYDGKYLTCSINGIAGVITVLNDKFSINADRVIFIPKIINLDLEYIKYILEPLLRNITKGRKGLFEKNEFTKLNPEMIKEVEIPIPIENEKISLNIQNNVSQKYKIIDEIKNNLELKILDILNTDIEF